MFIRQITYVLLVSSVIFTGSLYAREPEPVPGEVQAPVLRLPDLAGKTVNLQDFKGQVVLVNFWASWCPPCREEMPTLWNLQDEFRGKPFQVIAVNMAETKVEVNTFLPQAMKRDFVVLLDRQGGAVKQWKIPAFPTSYIVDKRGTLRYRLVGPAEWDSFDNKVLIRKLLAEPG